MDLKILQRFAGKTTSFSIVVPAARLYTRASYRAISSGSKSPPKPLVIFCEKSNISDSLITGKVVFPGLTRDM